jgi:hypothetical protein
VAAADATREQAQGQAGLLPAGAIPGVQGRVKEVTISGITGLDRAMTRYKVQCMGALFSGKMRVQVISHLITTPAALAQPSEKLQEACK